MSNMTKTQKNRVPTNKMILNDIVMAWRNQNFVMKTREQPLNDVNKSLKFIFKQGKDNDSYISENEEEYGTELAIITNQSSQR